VIVPKVGMIFESEKNAYEIYNTYAGQIGFSIRKSDIKRRVDKTIYSKLMVCSSQGFGETSSSQDTTRTGCNARIQFSVSREGIWTVHKIETRHNHYLASPRT
jgi:zinc finger SWIM domain-containing protein 3